MNKPTNGLRLLLALALATGPWVTACELALDFDRSPLQPVYEASAPVEEEEETEDAKADSKADGGSSSGDGGGSDSSTSTPTDSGGGSDTGAG